MSPFWGLQYETAFRNFFVEGEDSGFSNTKAFYGIMG